MKKLIICAGIVLLLYSCTKSPAPDKPPTPVSNLVISVIDYNPINHVKGTEKFTYDSVNNLVVLNTRSDDTSQGTVYLDSGSFYFTFDPAKNLPVSYTDVYKKYNYPVNEVEVHNLYYDNQKRLVQDSILSSSYVQGAPYSVYYFYSDNLIVANTYQPAYPIAQIVYVDSMFLNNGNLVRKADYYGGYGAPLTLESMDTVNGYTNDMNPLYRADLSNGLGGFLVDKNIFDGLSKNLTSDGGGNWVKDSNGRVVSGTGSSGDQFTFIYQ